MQAVKDRFVSSVDGAEISWGCTPNTKVLADQLSGLELFPRSGKVAQSWKHPALEKFRKAQNVVYDIFNNGLGNRGKQLKVLGLQKWQLCLAEYRNGRCIYATQWHRTEHAVEAAFTPIVLAAAKEQGLIE